MFRGISLREKRRDEKTFNWALSHSSRISSEESNRNRRFWLIFATKKRFILPIGHGEVLGKRASCCADEVLSLFPTCPTLPGFRLR